MSNNQKRYASIYGATRPILIHQYLVELIVKRRADKQKTKLPNQWWLKKFEPTYDYWKQIWNYETKFIKALVAKYDPECIIDAFNSFDCKDILSAKNPKLEKTIKEFQRRKDMLDSVKKEVVLETATVISLPRKQTGKPSKLSKLK